MARLPVVLLLLLGVCPRLGAAPLLFTDVTGQTGITFKHENGFSGTYHLIETVTAGLALFDYDNDGDPDIYLNNHGPNVLYRNNGDGTFTDVSQESGIGDHRGAGMGTICGDIDNDGDTDIIVANDMSGNFLFLNHGRGRGESDPVGGNPPIDSAGECGAPARAVLPGAHPPAQRQQRTGDGVLPGRPSGRSQRPVRGL